MASKIKMTFLLQNQRHQVTESYKMKVCCLKHIQIKGLSEVLVQKQIIKYIWINLKGQNKVFIQYNTKSTPA